MSAVYSRLAVSAASPHASPAATALRPAPRAHLAHDQ